MVVADPCRSSGLIVLIKLSALNTPRSSEMGTLHYSSFRELFDLKAGCTTFALVNHPAYDDLRMHLVQE